MTGVLGTMQYDDGTIPRVTIPGTPAYGMSMRPRPPPVFQPQPIENPDPDIDPQRANPVFLEAYRSLPGYALQQYFSSWEANALARAQQVDADLLGRPPQEEDYSPAWGAFTGSLQGLGSGNPLSVIGGALMGYAAEKEAFRTDQAKYQKAAAEYTLRAAQDQRDYLLKFGDSMRQARKDEWEMRKDERNFGRELRRDAELEFEFDRRLQQDAELAGQRMGIDRERLEMDRAKWNEERRAKQAEMPRPSTRPLYRPYGDIGAMAQDPRQKQARIETDAKEYTARKERYLNDQKEARQLSDKVGGSFDRIVDLLDPGETDANGKVLRAPGKAYTDMGSSKLSARLAELGQRVAGGPLPQLEAAVTALAQHQKLPGSGVWTDADQQEAREVIKSGDRDGMYRFFKAKRDQLNDLKQESADYDKYVASTGGQTFGFDDFRRDVSEFRKAGGNISADKYVELKARLQASDPEAYGVRPAMGEDGKPMPGWVYYIGSDGKGRAAEFRWGR